MSEHASSDIALAPPPARPAASQPDAAVAHAIEQLDTPALRADFERQGAFLYLDKFLAPDECAQLVALTRAMQPGLNRNYLPGHKQGGSVSRHTIDEQAPFIADLYRSKALIGWLEKVTGDKLQVCPEPIRTPTRSITTRARATISAGTTTPPITTVAATRC